MSLKHSKGRDENSKRLCQNKNNTIMFAFMKEYSGCSMNKELKGGKKQRQSINRYLSGPGERSC